MIDIEGVELSPLDAEILRHPLVGGVILFARNYADPEQVRDLTGVIHSLRAPQLLVAVDHEGGPVQRFRDRFTRLPACGHLGSAFDADRRVGLTLSEDCGWLMASELRAVGVDFSFAPVLDLGAGISNVIGERAFHRDPETIAWLAHGYVKGMNAAGMAAVGKHFQGHGSVSADSQTEVPVDDRDLEDLRLLDLVPFERLIHSGLEAIMPAHIIFSKVDSKPAGFSRRWLREILRGELAFQGTIFSDDISMAGAEVLGDYTERTKAALDAGCDMVLVCNNRDGVVSVLDTLGPYSEPLAQVRLMRMHGRHPIALSDLHSDDRWRQVTKELAKLEPAPELDLGDDAIT